MDIIIAGSGFEFNDYRNFLWQAGFDGTKVNLASAGRQMILEANGVVEVDPDPDRGREGGPDLPDDPVDDGGQAAAVGVA